MRGKPKPGSHDAGLHADKGLLGDAWRLADTGTGAPVPGIRPRRLCRTLCRRRRRAQTQRYHAQTELDLQEGGLHRNGGTNLASRSEREVCGLYSSSVSIATSTGMPHASIQSSRSTLRTPAGFQMVLLGVSWLTRRVRATHAPQHTHAHLVCRGAVSKELAAIHGVF